MWASCFSGHRHQTRGGGVPPSYLSNTQQLPGGHTDTSEDSLKSWCISSLGMDFLEHFVINDSFSLIPLSNVWHIQQSPACLHPHHPRGQWETEGSPFLHTHTHTHTSLAQSPESLLTWQATSILKTPKYSRFGTNRNNPSHTARC